MTKSRVFHRITLLAGIVAILLSLVISPVLISAAEPAPTPTPIPATLELQSKFPVLSNDSGQSFSFDVDVKYSGPDRKTFNLVVTPPKDWIAFCSAGYPEKQIAAIQMGPAEFPATETIKVNAIPVFGKLPDAGEYKVTLDVSSGNLKKTLELSAKVTAKYEFAITTDTGRLNAEATAGQDNHMSINLVNSGSASIDSVVLTSTKAEGWVITFKPDKIESLGAGQTQQVDVTINPPGGKTIAGDYLVNIKAEGKKISATTDIRVTVLTPALWGWVGIVIVVLVIIGLAVLFMKLGRR